MMDESGTGYSARERARPYQQGAAYQAAGGGNPPAAGSASRGNGAPGGNNASGEKRKKGHKTRYSRGNRVPGGGAAGVVAGVPINRPTIPVIKEAPPAPAPKFAPPDYAKKGAQKPAPQQRPFSQKTSQQKGGQPRNEERRGKKKDKRREGVSEGGGKKGKAKFDLASLFGKQPPPRHFDKKNAVFRERPRWSAPAPCEEPVPAFKCAICGRPIDDMDTAIVDKISGSEAHFECVHTNIACRQTLGPGDFVAYIGHGRFGVVHNDTREAKNFKLKSVLEWENPDNRPQWRGVIAEHFSRT